MSNFVFEGFEPANTTPVPDVLFDQLLAELNESELKVLLYIIRRTSGFKKPTDAISLTQFQKGIKRRATGEILDRGSGVTNRTAIIKALASLEKKGCIESTKTSDPQGDKGTSVYRIKFRSEVVRKTDHPLPIGSAQNGPPWYANGTTVVRETDYGVVRKMDPQETVIQETDSQETVIQEDRNAGAEIATPSSLSEHLNEKTETIDGALQDLTGKSPVDAAKEDAATALGATSEIPIASTTTTTQGDTDVYTHHRDSTDDSLDLSCGNVRDDANNQRYPTGDQEEVTTKVTPHGRRGGGAPVAAATRSRSTLSQSAFDAALRHDAATRQQAPHYNNSSRPATRPQLTLKGWQVREWYEKIKGHRVRESISNNVAFNNMGEIEDITFEDLRDVILLHESDKWIKEHNIAIGPPELDEGKYSYDRTLEVVRRNRQTAEEEKRKPPPTRSGRRNFDEELRNSRRDPAHTGK